MDPIAELLSQLSGVRSATRPSSSQLHQLQMELQLQRQQAQAHRQTLDRLARRAPGTSSAAAGPNPGTLSQPASSANQAAASQTATASLSQAGPQHTGSSKERKGEGFLLAALDGEDSGEEESSRESAKQRIFIQDIILSALNLGEEEKEESS